MPPDLAAGAYGHCLAVLRRADLAEDAAAIAVRRGGRSHLAVLANARSASLARAGEAQIDIDVDSEPDDLGDLAWRLAATRPAEERAVVDLEGRHGLDRAGLARTLGLSPMAGAARAAAVAEAWERELDPVLLAYLGPGECDGLATILEERGLWIRPSPPPDGSGGPITGEVQLAEIAAADGHDDEPLTLPMSALLAAGPEVAEHIAGCDLCSDRLRALVGVRALVAQAPLATPPAGVVLEARRARRRLPATPPPSIDGDARRWPRAAVVAGVVVCVVAASTAAGAQVLSHRRSRASHDSRVAALTKVPGTGSALVLSPPSLQPSTGTLTLTNKRPAPLSWKAAADVPWVSLSPSSGRLEQGGAAVIQVTVLPTSPEGSIHATITVTSNDGSAAAAEVAGTIERPPQVSAVISRCTVNAVTDDQSPRVELFWTAAPGPGGSVPMASVDGTYQAVLPSLTTALTWWVQVTDISGATVRTPDRVLPVGACAPTG